MQEYELASLDAEDSMQLIKQLIQENIEMRKEMQQMKLSINQLEQSNAEFHEIIRSMHPIINQVPVNRTNWMKQCPTKWSLTENGETYVVESSTTYGLRDSCGPQNLFKMTEGEPSLWGTEPDHQNNSWVTLEYPKKVKCNYLRIKNRENNIEDCPRKFEIRGSNINSFETGKYVVFDTIDNMKLGANEVKEFVFNNETEYKCYSIFILANNGNRASVLSELNFGYKL